MISVVVPTRNAGRTIRACLESIQAQTGVDVELIVVDNHSDDDTFAVAQQLADQAVVGGPERSAQRNRGIELSQGDWICWIDADMVLPPRVLAEALRVATADDVRAVAIPEISFGPGYWTACRALERECYVDDQGLHNPRLLHRSLLAELGGFGEDMAGPEDASMRLELRRRGERVGYADQVRIRHDEGRLTPRTIWAKRVYYGRSLPAFVSHNADAIAGQRREVLSAYWRNRGLLARHPLHAVGVVGMRSMEAIGYLWGAHLGRRSR